MTRGVTSKPTSERPEGGETTVGPAITWRYTLVEPHIYIYIVCVCASMSSSTSSSSSNYSFHPCIHYRAQFHATI